MWQKKKYYWNVSWHGKTIWEDYFSDSKDFDTEIDAHKFIMELTMDERNSSITLKKITTWEKVNV